MENIIKEIESDYSKLASLTASADDDNNVINLVGLRAGMSPSEAQIKYLISLPNVDYFSKSDIRKGNKWFVSACINIAKKYPDTNFKVSTNK